MNRSHDLRCRRCGALVGEQTVDGETAEGCICLIRLVHERVPSAWYRDRRNPVPTAD